MHAFRSFAVAAALLLGAVLVLPGAAGGVTQYVKTYGTSMEPSFQAGDLAVLRRSGTYEVGDVAAYRSPELGRVVLHRIVGRKGETFVLQGDNNRFADRERIKTSDMLGRLALRIPRGGTALTWLQQPLHAVPFAAALSVLPVVWGVRKRRDYSSALNPTRGTPMNPFTLLQLQRATPWLAAGAVASLLAGALALAIPVATHAGGSVLTHTGSFGYSASSSSSLYPNGFGTGDPVFTRLTNQVDVAFTYHAQSATELNAQGRVGLDAVLSGAGGWRRTESLVVSEPLNDGAAVVHARLDLPRLQALGDEAATITGTQGGPVRVEISPVVELSGTVGRHRLEERFEPTLAFSLDAAALRPAAPADGEPGGFVQTRDVTVGAAAPTQRSPIGVFAGALPPWSGLGFLAGGLLMMLATASTYAVGRRKGGWSPISSRHAHLLVPVEAMTRSADRPVVEVASMEALVRLAKHHGHLVLHQIEDGRPRYLVELLGTTYTHRPGTAPRGSVERAAA